MQEIINIPSALVIEEISLAIITTFFYDDIKFSKTIYRLCFKEVISRYNEKVLKREVIDNVYGLAVFTTRIVISEIVNQGK